MINITAEDAKLFEQNGFTKEQVGATINHYREQGLSDEDIQARMNAKIGEFRGSDTLPQSEQPSGIDLTPSGMINKAGGVIGAGLAAPFVAARENMPLKDAYNTALERGNEFRANDKLAGAQDLITDIAAYSRLPMLKTVGGVGRAAQIGRFAGNAAIQGGTIGALESLKHRGDLSGFGSGTGTALGVQSAFAGLPYVGKGIQRAIENPNVQSALTKGLEILTSVPQKFSQRALDAELAGNSILSGKFNPETAYRPIEQKLTQAKGMLPTATDFGNQYYDLGQKALRGMENLENKAGADIVAALEPLSNKEVQNGGLKNAVDSIIKSFGKGGVYNAALEESPQLVNYINNSLNKKGLTLMDLHRIKEALYNKGYAADALREGTTAEVARGVANQINNYLRKVSPSYAKPNDVYSVIKDVTRGLDSQNTIGSKLKNIGSTNSALSGLDQRLKNVDNLLPQPNKFYKRAQDIVNAENEVNNIVNTIGKQYERNPRLLANRTDEAFEQALEDLQSRTGVKFMDNLNDIRAREALEKLLPGQGGGSGSAQGAGNLIRAGLAGSGLTAGALFHNPLVLPGIASMSPKIMAKGTIQNLGKIYNAASKKVPLSVQKVINPLAIMLASPMLYGGITND